MAAAAADVGAGAGERARGGEVWRQRASAVSRVAFIGRGGEGRGKDPSSGHAVHGGLDPAHARPGEGSGCGWRGWSGDSVMELDRGVGRGPCGLLGPCAAMAETTGTSRRRGMTRRAHSSAGGEQGQNGKEKRPRKKKLAKKILKWHSRECVQFYNDKQANPFCG